MILNGWKTRIATAANFLTGLLMTADPSVLQAVSSDDAATRRFGFIMMGQGVLFFTLRQVTDNKAPPLNPWAKTND